MAEQPASTREERRSASGYLLVLPVLRLYRAAWPARSLDVATLILCSFGLSRRFFAVLSRARKSSLRIGV